MPETTRYGRQEPTFTTAPTAEYYDYTYGPEIAELFEEYGVTLTPAQRFEMDLYAARYIDELGRERFAGAAIATSRPRQTGKSFAVRLYSIFMAAIMGHDVLVTAQNTSTTKSHMSWIADFLRRHPDLYKLVVPNGIKYNFIDMSVTFVNGAKISFSTRTKSNARGQSFSVVIIDEAQLYTKEQQKAIQPTTIASPFGSQFIGLGSPPNPEDNIESVFRGWHDDAHDPERDSIWWVEWATPDVVTDITDVDAYYAYNPGMGYLIMPDEMLAHAQSYSDPLDFSIEYLGYWLPKNVYKPAINDERWQACQVAEDDVADGDLAYGVKFSPDGLSAALCIATRPKDKDKPKLVTLYGVLDVSTGVGAVGKILRPALKQSLGVVIDGKANASTLEAWLRDHGIRNKQLVQVTKYADLAESCASLVDGINSQAMCHVGFEQLTDAMVNVQRRPIGKGGAYGFISEDPSQAMIAEAAALAYQLATTSKRQPGKTMKLGV